MDEHTGLQRRELLGGFLAAAIGAGLAGCQALPSGRLGDSPSPPRLYNTEHVRPGDNLANRLDSDNTEYVIHGIHSLKPIDKTLSNVLIRGTKDAKLKHVGASTDYLLDITGTHITIQDLHFDLQDSGKGLRLSGNDAAGTPAIGNTVRNCRFEDWRGRCLESAGVHTTQSRHVRVIGNEFVGGTGGRVISASNPVSGWNVRDNLIRNAGANWAIYGERELRQSSIADNVINGAQGIFLAKFKQSSVGQNLFRAVSNACVAFAPGDIGPRDALLFGNVGSSVEDDGFRIRNGRDTAIVANVLEDGSGDGVLLELDRPDDHGTSSAAKYSIGFNSLTNFGRAGIRLRGATLSMVGFNNCNQNSARNLDVYSGIQLQHGPTAAEPCLDNFVGFNTCTDTHSSTTQKYGIEEQGTSNHNHIQFNGVSGNSVGGISTAGAETRVQSNRGYRTENKGLVSGAIDPHTPSRQTTTVTHGLDVTPTAADISVVLANGPDRGERMQVEQVRNIDETTFDVIVDVTAPAQGWGDRADLAWSVKTGVV